MTAADLKQDLLKVDVPFEAREALHDIRQTVIQLQQEQLKHGLRADGKMIGKYRSKVYAAKKHAMNPLPGLGNMDWKLTGALHKDLFIDVREDIYIMDSADSKTGSLIERFGDPFGLSEESIETLISSELDDVFMGRMQKVTGL